MKTIVSIAALIAASLQVAQAGTIAAWTFENDSIAVNNSPAPSTGSGTASSIGMATYPTPNIGVTTDDVVVGATGDTGTNGNADLTNIWRVRAQAGTAGAANGWSSLAPIGTQGAVFAASTVGYSNITVSFDWYATTQGEAKLQLQYTTDGATWHNVPLTLSAIRRRIGGHDQHHLPQYGQWVVCDDHRGFRRAGLVPRVDRDHQRSECGEQSQLRH